LPAVASIASFLIANIDSSLFEIRIDDAALAMMPRPNAPSSIEYFAPNLKLRVSVRSIASGLSRQLLFVHRL
jgi:hypothetical protein